MSSSYFNKVFKHGLAGALFFLMFLEFSQASQPVTINGKNLTVEEVIKVAKQNSPIQIDEDALAHAKNSHDLLLLAAEKDLPVYGLNRGVGLNKDKIIFSGDVLL